MGDFLKSSGRGLIGGWWFWAGVLLILPNCSFNVEGLAPGRNLDPGTAPHTAAIFCDIAMERRCATPEDLAMGTRLASAAVALVAGQAGTTIGLDYSPAALGSCSGGPQAVVFQGPFPQGLSVCVNCGETISPTDYADATAVCQAQCHDLFGTTSPEGSFTPENPPSAETIAFCTDNARASTNFPLNSCYEDACTTGGTLRLDFADPRRIPEAVSWINLNGVSASGGTLTRTAAATGNYDTGASSSQLIAAGDAYLEFTAAENTTHRTAGLSSGPPPPGNIVFEAINFGILLTDYGEMWVVESGALVSSFGLYAAGEKFRVKLRDNFDGTATVTYVRLTGPCMDGSPCNETVFHTSANLATYPVRVDAMFRDLGATVTEARIVRIR